MSRPKDVHVPAQTSPQFSAVEWVGYRTKLASLIEDEIGPAKSVERLTSSIAESLLVNDLIVIAKLDELGTDQVTVRGFEGSVIRKHPRRTYPEGQCEDASCRATYVHEHGGDCSPSCICHPTETGT